MKVARHVHSEVEVSRGLRGNGVAPLSDPRPIELSHSERHQIELTLAKFIEDKSSPHAQSFHTISALNVLPLYFDWSGFFALRRDGQIISVPYDEEPGETELVRDELHRNFARARGAKLHPELPFLEPARPCDAVVCSGCNGSGKLTFPKEYEHLRERIHCGCGGLGWVPLSSNFET